MRENPKILDGYWKTYYWIEWIPQYTDTNGDKQGGYHVDQPVEFRATRYNQQGTTREQRQMVQAQISTDTTAQIETRTNIPFKREDYILENLNLLPYAQKRLNNLRYDGIAMIESSIELIDEELDVLNLRGVDTAKRKVLTVI